MIKYTFTAPFQTHLAKIAHQFDKLLFIAHKPLRLQSVII